jgi:hypothetical protein
MVVPMHAMMTYTGRRCKSALKLNITRRKDPQDPLNRTLSELQSQFDVLETWQKLNTGFSSP